MNKSEKLKKRLEEYSLDLDVFLDMKDLWDGMKSGEKIQLLNEHEERLKRLRSLVSGNPSNVSKPNYENAHFNGEAY